MKFFVGIALAIVIGSFIGTLTVGYFLHGQSLMNALPQAIGSSVGSLIGMALAALLLRRKRKQPGGG